MVMKNAALNAIKAYLDRRSAVGTEINVGHLAATLAGRIVTGEAEITTLGGGSSSGCARQRAVRRSGP
jgi:fluoroacetyl-CoA thioesterase